MLRPLYEMLPSEMQDVCLETYDKLAAAAKKSGEAKIQLALSKNVLETCLNNSIMDGAIQGKNERERDAVAYSLYPELHEEVKGAEIAVMRADLEFALAKIEEQKLVQSVRIFNLALSKPE